MIIFLSLLICFIGVAVYILSEKPKVMEIGWVMMATGLLAFLIKVGPGVFDVISK